MAKRVFNFNPGPATLPLEVLETAQAELLDYRGSGLSVLESSHRSPEFSEINQTAMDLVRELLGLGDSYKILFMGGGASSQFALVPLNLRSADQTGVYVDTGAWSKKAIKEANLAGNAHVMATSKDKNYNYIPDLSGAAWPDNAAYVHITTNNTIFGTQYHAFPETGDIPLICDMSSDIASRPLDYTQFGMIYAGAQKNLGPAGVTVVAIREDLLARSPETLPTMFNYNTYAKKDSLYNTPPAFPIYMVKLVLEWIKARGGLKGVGDENQAKRDLIYGFMDGNADFYRGTAEKGSRSWMNVTMRLPTEALEKKLIADGKAAGFNGLKGHRSVGGIRMSIYNAMRLEAISKLVEFLEGFMKAA